MGGKLAEHCIDCTGKTARPFTNSDYNKYDLLVGMDRADLRNMRRICGDHAGKMHPLMEFTNQQGIWESPGIPTILKLFSKICWDTKKILPKYLREMRVNEQRHTAKKGEAK